LCTHKSQVFCQQNTLNHLGLLFTSRYTTADTRIQSCKSKPILYSQRFSVNPAYSCFTQSPRKIIHTIQTHGLVQNWTTQRLWHSMKADVVNTHLLDQIWEGKRIPLEEAHALFDLPLPLLGFLANHRRELATKSAYEGAGPRIVTYTVDRNINYTNICVTRCKFCAFSRDIDAGDGYVLSIEELDQKIQEAIQLGATQILLQGGHHPSLPFDWYLNLLNHIKTRFPSINVHGFSPPEIVHFSQLTGLPIDKILVMFKEAGLGSLPGGGAEILVDRVRKIISPHKATATQWLEVMDAAHQVGLYSTATMMLGHIETQLERLQHLEMIRQLQDRALARRLAGGINPPICTPPSGQPGRPPQGPGYFTSFICWTYQPQNTPMGGTPVGAVEYLKTLAIARIYLDNFPSIQCSWVTQGPEIGQLALLHGANDFGSVMLEENVVRAAGSHYYLTEFEIKRLISELGFQPRKRDTWYRLID